MSLIQKIIQRPCEILGKENLPVYTVSAVALFKGLFRPAFTMMDKKQDFETKKYAAFREGATELIAIPTYIVLSWVTRKFLGPAFSPTGKTVNQLLENSRSTLGFFGVCLAALYVIPKLCNLAMPHIMKKLKIEKKKNIEGRSLNPSLAKNQYKTESMPLLFQNMQIRKITKAPNFKTSGGSGGLKV